MQGPRLYNLAMEVIYLDSLFFLNLLTDYLICLASARLCGLRLRRGRYLAAALIGAFYAVAVFLPGCGFLSSTPMKLCLALVMGLAAFGREQQPLKCTLMFLAVSAALGGAVWAVSLAAGSPSPPGSYAPVDTKLLIISFAVCYGVFSVVFRCRAKLMDRKRIEVRVRFLGQENTFMALSDTGNSLTDPITLAPVMIATPHALKPLFGDAAALLDVRDCVELLDLSSAYPRLSGRLRVIPYSVLGSGGMLPVFRPDSVFLDGRENRELLIAVSPDAHGDGFEAIV